MKTQSVVIVFALLLQLATAAAQTAPTATDAVHLHSGQVHRGIVVEQKPGESIRLWRIAEGDTLTFDMEQIERIAKLLPVAEASPAALIPPTTSSGSAFNNNPWTTALQFSTGGGDHSLVRLDPAQQTSRGVGSPWLARNDAK